MQPGTKGSTKSADCLPCTPGQYQPSIARQSCLMCPNGQFQSEIGQHVCDGCLPGQFTVYDGSDSEEACVKCPGGQYAENKITFAVGGSKVIRDRCVAFERDALPPRLTLRFVALFVSTVQLGSMVHWTPLLKVHAFTVPLESMRNARDN
jgi:hypothetical protein